jgi:hypothetical protein
MKGIARTGRCSIQTNIIIYLVLMNSQLVKLVHGLACLSACFAQTRQGSSCYRTASYVHMRAKPTTGTSLQASL